MEIQQIMGNNLILVKYRISLIEGETSHKNKAQTGKSNSKILRT